MNPEALNLDYKSLRKAIGAKANHRGLAETCVCFANAQGGKLIIGIEDQASEPPAGQKIEQEDLNALIKSLRSLTEGVVLANYAIHTHANGGQYMVLQILPATRSIATTSSGKVLIRISDNCYPVSSEELTDLAAQKTAFQWEVMAAQKIKLNDIDTSKLQQFLHDVKASERVSDFVKEKDDQEILALYQMLHPEGYLTNLGILWLGTPTQRARLSYPITLQYIVYNEMEEKVRKKEWHFHLHNPKELLLEVEAEAVELTYTTELPDGLFRKTIRHYAREVVRELLINAIAHKKYTVSGDVFVEVHPAYLKITSPGGLPLGVTVDNILHQRHRRNPHLIKILRDIKLMEGEGSGYDLIYEKLVRDAKPLPVIESEYSSVSITVKAGLVSAEVVSILDYIDNHFQLKQREYITLGIIATEKKILSTQLAQKLQLREEDRVRDWMGSLLQKGIIVTQGIKKGTQYLLNPVLFQQARIGIEPSLKTIEPYKLEALIEEDLKYNGISLMREIQERLQEAGAEEVQKAVYRMVKSGILSTEGGNRNRRYALVKNK